MLFILCILFCCCCCCCSGVVTQPITGAVNGGWRGLVKGVGVGMLGVITKPMGGAMDLVASTSQSLLQSTGTKNVIVYVYGTIKQSLALQRLNALLIWPHNVVC